MEAGPRPPEIQKLLRGTFAAGGIGAAKSPIAPGSRKSAREDDIHRVFHRKCGKPAFPKDSNCYGKTINRLQHFALSYSNSGADFRLPGAIGLFAAPIPPAAKVPRNNFWISGGARSCFH